MAYFIVQTRYCSPLRFAELGRGLGFPFYCPSQEWRAKNRYVRTPVLNRIPLFPTYCFLREFAPFTRLNPPDLSAVKRLAPPKTSVLLVRSGSQPDSPWAQISEEEMAEVRATEEEINFQLAESTKMRDFHFRAGDVVRITRGVLEGRLAKIKRAGRSPLLVLLDQGDTKREIFAKKGHLAYVSSEE